MPASDVTCPPSFVSISTCVNGEMECGTAPCSGERLLNVHIFVSFLILSDFLHPSSCVFFFFVLFLSGLQLEQLDPVERLQPDMRRRSQEALSLRNQSSSGFWGASLQGRASRDRHLQHRTLLW